MPIVRKKRLPDGSFSEPQKVGQGESNKEIIDRLEKENLNVMEAAALLYEEKLLLQQSLIDNMEATALLYEELLTLKEGN